MSGARIFSKLDANSGFWQVKLEEESRQYTTFIAPFGRFWFNRLPFGITSAPEYFQKRMSRILEGLDGVICLTDDILIWGANQDQHDIRLRLVLKKLKQANVTLNKEKSQFSVKKIKFLGHVINETGVHPDPDKVEAIRSMEKPINVEELRRFLGMVNYLERFIPNLSHELQPLNGLLGKEIMWYWDTEQETAFKKVKEMLCSDVVLALYDPMKETILSTDASSYGLGAVLRQLQEDGKIRPVAYASRALTSTERKYAQVEKECLGIVWGCERLRDLLIGKHFHIETDHKPLVSIMTHKQLDELPARLQRMKMRMMQFTYTISHIPGKELVAADTLSRAPSSKKKVEDQDLMKEIEAMVRQVVQDLPSTDGKLEEIRKSQKENKIFQQLYRYSQVGWPDKEQTDLGTSEYWKFRNELSTQEGLLMMQNRLVIPPSMRTMMLHKIHEGHMGIARCRQRAKTSVWWPGIGSEIKKLVVDCSRCIEHRTNPREPLLPSSFPSRPWEKVGLDLFYWKARWWIIVTDYFSRYPEIMQLTGLKTVAVINCLRSIFARHGIPQILRSDNGPQFHVIKNPEFARYAGEEGFTHTTSSPRYPRSNGLVEASVKTVKHRLMKSNCPYAALLAYRNAPLENGCTPAQLLMGRRLRTSLPVARSQLQPKWPDLKCIGRREEIQRRKRKLVYDHRYRATPLAKLKPNENVWITDLQRGGRVIDQHETPRSYIVETAKGTVIRRNRYHLVPSPNMAGPEDDLDEEIEGNVKKHDGETDDSKPWEKHEEKVEPTRPGVEAEGAVYTRTGRLIKPPQRLNL